MSIRSQTMAMNMQAPGPGPSKLEAEIDKWAKTLVDPQAGSEEKHKALTEIVVFWEQIAANQPIIDPVLRTFFRILSETMPQFVADNHINLQRKRVLELILRSASSEYVKSHAKDLTKILLRLLPGENEENAILAIKIMTDLWKSTKLQVIQELNPVITFCKQAVKDVAIHLKSPDMFENRDIGLLRQVSAASPEEIVVSDILPYCFHIQTATIQVGDTAVKVTVIPRAAYSVKFIQELSMFFVFIYQHLKAALLPECLDFLVICIEYAGLEMPPPYRDTQSFNKVLADDFYTSQAKALCFVSIMGKIREFLEVIEKHANELITAILTLLKNIPPELVTVRKEVLMTLKFCFTNDGMRTRFLPHLPRLLEEEILLGSGFTSQDSLRVLMYQMLADLLHHMRNNLSYTILAQVLDIFCHVISDTQLSVQVQVMCVRLLLSLCEPMPKLEQQGEAVRDLLIHILESCVMKVERMAICNLPSLIRVYGDPNAKQDVKDKDLSASNESLESILPSKMEAEAPSSESPMEIESQPNSQMEVDVKPSLSSKLTFLAPPTKTGKHSSPEAILNNLWAVNSSVINLNDARNMLKYVITTCKFCTQQLTNTRRSEKTISYERERDLFRNLLYYGLQCMDIFALGQQGQNKSQQSNTGRSKDEKETLETFAALFIMIDTEIFREIFSANIDFLVDRIYSNASLQLVINLFLVKNCVCASVFGGIMLKYLMEKLPLLSVSNEQTGFYLKLFKIIFSAIGCTQPQSSSDGELMLKPYLPELIRNSTTFALTAREPLNYFLLLRALFRSIGGGAHDILYGHFLPLLPNLLQFLNKLQSCHHRQQMRELFLELCLTVPVRLSSLLPYLPLLMDPLVYALNGSTSLVQQGLRTLELCVDNLQPEYLLENMAPVRSALMQGLWKVLGSSPDMNSAMIAFRILGKFGGGNRRILNYPQQLKPTSESELLQAVLTVEFSRDIDDEPCIAELSLSEIMSVAVEQMRLCITPAESMTGLVSSLLPAQFVNQSTLPNAGLIRINCMELARSVFLLSLSPHDRLSEDWKGSIVDSIKEQLKHYDGDLEWVPLYKCSREYDRRLFIDALVVLLMGVVGKDLRRKYIKFFNSIVRQLTLNAIMEFYAHDISSATNETTHCLDGAILIDAIAAVLSDPNKDFLRSAVTALFLINDTFETVLGDKVKITDIPFVRYLMERMTSLCYGPSWFARFGGASALGHIIDKYPVGLLVFNFSMILTSLCEVIVGLSDEISSGAVDIAVAALKSLQHKVFTECDPNTKSHLLDDAMKVYTPLSSHGCQSVRNHISVLIVDLGSVTEMEVSFLLETHRNLVSPEIERITKQLKSMAMTDQAVSLGFIDWMLRNAPGLVVEKLTPDVCQDFFESLFEISEADPLEYLSNDSVKCLTTCPAHFLPPSPIVQQFQAVQAAALDVALLCSRILCCQEMVPEFLGEIRDKAQLRALGVIMAEIDRTELPFSNKILLECSPLAVSLVQPAASVVIETIRTQPEVNAVLLLKLGQILDLCPDLFDLELATLIVNKVSSWNAGPNCPIPERRPNDAIAIQCVLKMMLKLKEDGHALAIALFELICFLEQRYCNDTAYTWWPTMAEFLARTPEQSLILLLTEHNILKCISQLKELLRQEKAQPLRLQLLKDFTYFDRMLDGKSMLSNGEWIDLQHPAIETTMNHLYNILQLIEICSAMDLNAYLEAADLAQKMRLIFNDKQFKKRYAVGSALPDGRRTLHVHISFTAKYGTPFLLVSNLLKYFKGHPEEIEILFELLTVFEEKFAADFGFFRDFLEKDVIPVYSLEWRKNVFFAVLDKLLNDSANWVENPTLSKILQYLLIPCLQWAFERYPVDEILGEPLADTESPEQDETQQNQAVAKLSVILNEHRSELCDKNSIALYQLCTLLVEFAPAHIHNINTKKQGGRLRVFMLFAWPSLTMNTYSDPTVRFSAFNFLAHIIEKFAINRKIVLQVFHILAGAYQLDHRDLVKKAVDVLTPAVPIRIADDGCVQMFNSVKKILTEESHNLQQIQHVVQMITRNYRIYFYVRHDLMKPLITAIQHILHTPNGLVEGLTGRKLALEVCEMAIKWDLLRNQRQEQTQAGRAESSNAEDVESVLEQLKGEKEDRDDGVITKDAGQDTQGRADSPIRNEHVDHIVNLLLKFACSSVPPGQPQQYAQTTTDMSRRSLSLLRAALKPVVWGRRVQIKVSWIERQLSLPSDRQDSSLPQQHHIQQAQQTLEVLLTLSSVMPKELILTVLRPLQRAIISCMNSNNSSLLRTVNYLVGKLFDKTKSSPTGLEELDILNKYIIKYLMEQFSSYARNANAYAQQVFTPFALLRSICSHQPGYLEAVCLQHFIKVLEKATGEHVSFLTASAQGHGQDPTREKGVAELLSLSLELLRERVEFLSYDVRRSICASILLPLVNTNYEKIIENLIKITDRMIFTHKDDSFPNAGLSIAVHLFTMIDKRVNIRGGSISTNSMNLFLNMVLKIFDEPKFRACEFADKLEDAFYWGMVSPDAELREKFMLVWERNLDRRMMLRLEHMFKHQNWALFGENNWLRQVCWMLLRCVSEEGELRRKRISFADCATLWRSVEVILLQRETPSLGASNLASAGMSSRSTPSCMEGETDVEREETRLDILMNEQRQLFADATDFDGQSMINSVLGLVLNIQDSKFVGLMWKRLFNSLWSRFRTSERDRIAPLIEPFLLSGVHAKQTKSANSVIATFLDTVNASVPPIQLSPRAIQWLSSSHHSWHRGILMLENHVSLLTSTSSISHLLGCGMAQDLTNEATDLMISMEYLTGLYTEIAETDQAAAVWQRRAFSERTISITNSMQRGEVSKACMELEDALSSMEPDLPPDTTHRMATAQEGETQYLIDTYAKCLTELMEWDKLFSLGDHEQSARLTLKAAVQIPSWNLVQSARDQISGSVPPDFANEFHIYNAMLAIMGNDHFDAQRQDSVVDPMRKQRMERAVEEASASCAAYWRSLPSIVGNSHVPVLQAMSMIREVADCIELKCSLEEASMKFNGSILNDMKTLIKTWRNRITAISDDLSFVAGIYNWRCQVNTLILRRFDDWERSGTSLPYGTNSQSILPIHSAAQGQVVVAKTARLMKLYEAAYLKLDQLNSMVTVPTMDAHQKICAILKTIKNEAENVDPRNKPDLLLQGLALINDTNISDFSKDQISRLLCLKGTFLSRLDKREEALKAYSTAAQCLDPAQNSNNIAVSVFKAWGHHMDRLFQEDCNEMAAITSGAGAIACYLEAARCDNELKARKYIGRLLWTAKHMIAQGADATSRLDEQIDKFEKRIVPLNWLYWLPQLINEIKQRPESSFVKIIAQLVENHPMQVFYWLRDTLPSHLIDDYVSDDVKPEKMHNGDVSEELSPWITNLLPILKRACSLRPADAKMFHALMNELSEMREFWYEKHYRFSCQLKDDIFKYLHQQRNCDLAVVSLDQPIRETLEDWKAELRKDVSNSLTEAEIALGAQDTVQLTPEREFIKSVEAEIESLLSSVPENGVLLKFLEMVIKINQRLHKRISKLPKRIPLRTVSSFLADFNHRKACIEMPSDLLSMNIQKTTQYLSVISRFDPFVTIAQEGGDLIRRIHLRAHTGKISTFYWYKSVKNGSRKNAVGCQQFLNSLNTVLVKERETCRRYLWVHSPTQLQVSDSCSILEVATGVVVDRLEPLTESPVIQPIDILAKSLNPIGMRPDDVIVMFYERLLEDSSDEARLRIVRDLTVEEFVSLSTLLRYIMQCYPDPTHFYHVRKQFGRYFAVLSLMEYLLRLTPVGLGDMMINRQTAQYHNPNYNFQIPSPDEVRPVPFRLTPNLCVFLGITLEGDFRWSLEATARCLASQQPLTSLRPILYDFFEENYNGPNKWQMVNSMVTQFEQDATTLDKGLAPFDVPSLLEISRAEDKISRMNPALHPWF